MAIDWRSQLGSATAALRQDHDNRGQGTGPELKLAGGEPGPNIGISQLLAATLRYKRGRNLKGRGLHTESQTPSEGRNKEDCSRKAAEGKQQQGKDSSTPP